MYGLLISSGVLGAIIISKKAVEREGLNVDLFYPTVNVAIIASVIGARAYHVLDYWNYYSENLYQIFAIWRGGLGIFGALIGGITAAILYLNLKSESITRWLNPLILGIPLAQAIGRWGNYFNKEIFGKETDLPWGWTIGGRTYHPIFLYESVLCALIFLLMYLLYIRTKKLPEGILLPIYVGSYGLVRFGTGFLRVDDWYLGNMNIAQTLSLLSIFFSVTYVVYVLKSKR